MRLVAVGVLACGVVVAAACAHEEHAVAPPSQPMAAPLPAGFGPPLGEGPAAPLSYVVADPTSRSAAMSLTSIDPPEGMPASSSRPDAFGVILDGTRLISRAASLRAARDVTDPPLLAAHRVPAWLGGGYLFRSRSALYASPSFDGSLRAVVSLPSEIEGISFGPRAALVRSELGERWGVDLATGARVAVSPVGAVDVGALADGRAAAITERGAVLVSSDAGAHWSDVTSQLASRPEEILTVDEALWIVQATGPAFRVDPGAHLAVFDKAPVVKAPELRPKDPRWHGDEAPIRRAIRLGTPLDDGTALVAAEGDLVRINLVTGDVLTSVSARLPPDLQCEAVRTPDDVLLVCAKGTATGGALVASHAGTERSPVIEQTFAAAGQFYASDDGALVFGGPCARAKPSRLVVCVRGPGGAWQELDVEPFLASDGGPPVEVGRWVPKGDGGAVGLIAGATAGTIDARTGDQRTWQLEGLAGPVKASITEARGRGVGRDSGRIVDRTWSTTATGGLRGWGDGGAAIDVAADGAVVASPFTFDRVATAGPYAFARTRDGRAWQTTDRGLSWAEVAAPPTTRASGYQEPRFCSAVGCDLSSWYRVGWVAASPAAAPQQPVAAPPPRVTRAAAATLTCRPLGEPKTNVLVRSDRSPDDLGLGASRVAVGDDGNVDYARTMFARTIPNPAHEFEGSFDSDYPAARLVLHGRDLHNLADDAPGYRTELLGLRRQATFVAPFDPAATLRRTTLTAGDVVAAARASGLRPSDLLSPDLLALTALVPVTPVDPAAPSDLAFSAENGLVGVLRATGRARYGPRLRSGDETKLVSAAALGPEEIALLEAGDGGSGVVVKLGTTGLVELFEVPATVGPLSYPANPDALAVGPHGELALVRARSAGEPPSEKEPALLFGTAGAVTALAPWSTLVTAEDPSCKADTAGYRTTLQIVASWVKIAGMDVRLHDEAPMLARVKWSPARVCLEAIEVRVDDSRASIQQRSGAVGPGGLPASVEPPQVLTQAVESWIVARFAGTASAARVGILPGVETRTPLQCALGP